MSRADQTGKPDVNALLEEVRQRVERKKADGSYDLAELRRVEEAAVSISAAADDGAEAEVALRHAKLQELWDAAACGVTTHRAGTKARAILGLKRFLHKAGRFFSNIWLARQVLFNDELVKLLNVLVPQHGDLRHRMLGAERRLDDVEDLARQVLSGLKDLQHGSEARLSALEREAAGGSARVEELLARLERLLAEQAEKGAVSQGVVAAVSAERGRARSQAYLAFEDLHRGSREEIKRRQEVYLPYFQGADQKAPVLDLGCGRGEFLELMAERGLPARGLDLNPEMVAQCKERGLTVVEADAVEHLRSLPDASLGGIMAAQLIEHLPLDALMELVSLAAAKLRDGAPFVAETVNPACLTTFSGAFYLDLTHQKPIHPEAARFLWRWAGLREVEIVFVSPYPPDHRLERFGGEGPLADAFNRNVERLNQLLYSHQDFAVVGRR